ncbi:Na-translocating system protein MpsC family protein [Saccharibacillus brassicae]|uniref:DUF2294 family protein n=1 Tax=Saccharibacillus brassicae TaxID=2583377 RepID=A0A4Y6V3F7_SACBS|nr:Na-translocating system protein MpsC family protein [Saccharibacillus brassicae]QDH23037.1 DUF2294 family protein [Saccharibacillus brassicae]
MPETESFTSLETYSDLLCKSQFGKPPESTEIYSNERCVVFLLHGLIDARDSRLPDDPDERYTHIHILLDQFIYPSLKPKIEASSDKKVSNVFIDWKSGTNTAMIAVFFHPVIEAMPEDLYAGKADLHQQVDLVTSSVQKPPLGIESFRMDGRFVMILRYGLMISLEKRLVKKGFNNQLRVTKREVELDSFLEQLPIEKLLSRKLKAAYLDWAFEDDISLLMLELDGDVS